MKCYWLERSTPDKTRFSFYRQYSYHVYHGHPSKAGNHNCGAITHPLCDYIVEKLIGEKLEPGEIRKIEELTIKLAPKQ